MKKIAFLLTLFIVSFLTIIKAQNSKIDSLKLVLKQYTKDDSVKADLLNNLAFSFSNINTDTCKLYAQQAYRTSKKINYLNGEGFAYHNIACYHWIRGNLDSTIIYCNKGLDIFERTKDPKGLLKCNNVIGIAYSDRSNYNKAIEYYFKCLDICNQPNTQHLLARIYNNIGIIYSALGNYKVSKEYYLKSLKYNTLYNDSIGMGVDLNNLGSSYFLMDSFRLAKKYIIKSIYHNTSIDNIRILASSYSNLGQIYDNEDMPDSAIFYLDKSLKISSEYRDKININSTKLAISYHYYLNGNLSKALSFINEAIPTFIEGKNLAFLSTAYEYLNKIYDEKNDLEKSYYYLSKYVQIEDSLNKEMAAQNLAVTDAEYNYRLQKEKTELNHQASLLKQKNEKRIFMGSSIFILIILVLISINLYQRTRTNRILKNANETRDKMMRLIAHDFRSPLISISSIVQTIPLLIEEKDTASINQMLERVEGSVTRVLTLIDNLINWTLSQNESIPYNPGDYNLKDIANEISEVYKPVAEFKQIDLKNNITKDTIIFADKNILRTILRNLINNAIKFTPEKGQINLFASNTDKKITICVQDTGIGIKESKLNDIFNIDKDKSLGTKGEKGNGLGLFFCKEFAAKNKGELWVESESGKGSSFYFTVPLSIN